MAQKGEVHIASEPDNLVEIAENVAVSIDMRLKTSQLLIPD